MATPLHAAAAAAAQRQPREWGDLQVDETYMYKRYHRAFARLQGPAASQAEAEREREDMLEALAAPLPVCFRFPGDGGGGGEGAALSRELDEIVARWPRTGDARPPARIGWCPGGWRLGSGAGALRVALLHGQGGGILARPGTLAVSRWLAKAARAHRAQRQEVDPPHPSTHRNIIPILNFGRVGGRVC